MAVFDTSIGLPRVFLASPDFFMDYSCVGGSTILSSYSMPHPAATRTAHAAPDGARTPLRVGVILADHFTLSAFAVFIDHLRLAADEGDRSRPMHVQWSIMSSGREP